METSQEEQWTSESPKTAETSAATKATQTAQATGAPEAAKATCTSWLRILLEASQAKGLESAFDGCQLGKQPWEILVIMGVS